MILQNLLKSLMTWLMNLALSCYDYVANALLDIFGMNLDVFKANVPVTADIMNILLAAGWALLLGNLVFQALKGMLSGLGFESESPAILFARTFVFGFLLLASRQICGIAMNMTGTVIELLKIPDAVTMPVPNENDFLFGASWVFVLIVNSVMMWQVLKLFLIIAERYVMMVFLVIVAPLAFAMGGSKQTEDIFKGYARMLGSVCLMVLLNVVMLKLMLSAMGGSDGGPLTVVWLMLLIGIGRLAKKLDEMVSRIGLNTARTGVAMGGGVPGMLAMAAIRMGTKQVGSHISKGSQKFEKDQGGKGSSNHGGSGAPHPSPKGPRPSGPQNPQGSGGAPGNSEKTGFTYADGTYAGGGVVPEPSMSEQGRKPSRPPVGKHRPPAMPGTAPEQGTSSGAPTSANASGTSGYQGETAARVPPQRPSYSKNQKKETPDPTRPETGTVAHDQQEDTGRKSRPAGGFPTAPPVGTRQQPDREGFRPENHPPLHGFTSGAVRQNTTEATQAADTATRPAKQEETGKHAQGNTFRPENGGNANRPPLHGFAQGGVRQNTTETTQATGTAARPAKQEETGKHAQGNTFRPENGGNTNRPPLHGFAQGGIRQNTTEATQTTDTVRPFGRPERGAQTTTGIDRNQTVSQQQTILQEQKISRSTSTIASNGTAPPDQSNRPPASPSPSNTGTGKAAAQFHTPVQTGRGPRITTNPIVTGGSGTGATRPPVLKGNPAGSVSGNSEVHSSQPKFHSTDTGSQRTAGSTNAGAGERSRPVIPHTPSRQPSNGASPTVTTTGRMEGTEKTIISEDRRSAAVRQSGNTKPLQPGSGAVNIENSIPARPGGKPARKNGQEQKPERPPLRGGKYHE